MISLIFQEMGCDREEEMQCHFAKIKDGCLVYGAYIKEALSVTYIPLHRIHHVRTIGEKISKKEEFNEKK
jgi:uncharacterized protein (UPF0248 family)